MNLALSVMNSIKKCKRLHKGHKLRSLVPRRNSASMGGISGREELETLLRMRVHVYSRNCFA